MFSFAVQGRQIIIKASRPAKHADELKPLFNFLSNHISGNHAANLRCLIDASMVKLGIWDIKWSVVKAMVHFRKSNTVNIDKNVSAIAVVLSSDLLIKVAKFVLNSDSTDVLFTTSMDEAKTWLYGQNC